MNMGTTFVITTGCNRTITNFYNMHNFLRVIWIGNTNRPRLYYTRIIKATTQS